MPENKPTKATVINVFIDKMMAEKGLNDIVQKDQLSTKLEEQIEQAMIRALPDDKLTELEEMIEREANDEEVEAFFEGAGVDFQSVAEKTMADFRAAFLNGNMEG